MQCPNCGFENIPGRDECCVCSSALVSKPEPETVFPPRAKNRGLWWQVRWRITTNPVVSALTRRTEDMRRRVDERVRSLRINRGTPYGLRETGEILLAAVPGVAHMRLSDKPSYGTWMLLSSAALLGLAAILYRNPLSNILLVGLLLMSMYSMCFAFVRLHSQPRSEWEQFRIWVGAVLFVIGIYLGSYFTLRMVAQPWITPIRVVAAYLPPGIRRGDMLLIRRTDQVSRGDLVTARLSWNGQEVETLGVVIAVPGDHVVLSDRLYVNSRPVGLFMPAAHADGQEITEITPVLKDLEKDTYLVVPYYGNVQLYDLSAILNNGIVNRTNIHGRAVAVTAPAPHRKIIQPILKTE